MTFPDLLRSSNVEAIVSPGPGKPSDYPILTEIMNQFEVKFYIRCLFRFPIYL